MAGQAASSIRIAIKGRVLTAPIGSTAPVDVVSAWPAAWSDHGFTDQSGVLVTPKPTSYDVKAWQSDNAVRTRMTERLREVAFKLIQGGGLNTMLYNGGGAWTALPSRSVNDGVITSGSAAITSATAAFVVGDVGAAISGPGIPASTTILSRQSATAVTMSNNATMTATAVALAIGGTTTYLYTPPQPGTDDNRMLGIEWNDGLITKREVYPSSIVIAVSGYPLKSTGELQLDVTFRVLTDSWFVLSNDPADNPAALVA